MQYRLVGIVVADSKLFNVGGDVYRWANRVERQFNMHAIAESPVNSRANKSPMYREYPPGSLRRSIESDFSRIGPRHMEITVSVHVPYALAVLKGTSRIYSRSARIPKGQEGAGQFAPLGEGAGMRLPPNAPYRRAVYRQSVSGQRANNFLGRAFDNTARTHSSLRRGSMGSF